MIYNIMSRWRQIFYQVFRFSSPFRITCFLLIFVFFPTAFFLSGYLDYTIFEKKILDYKIRFLSSSLDLDPRILVVEIDSHSLSQIQCQWPWPRDVYAGLVNRLKAGNPLGIIFTIFFLHLENQPLPSPGDTNFADAVKSAGNVYFSKVVQKAVGGNDDATVIIPPHSTFLNASRGAGISKVFLDEDNICRTIPLVASSPEFQSITSLAAGVLGAQPFMQKNLLVMYARNGQLPRLPIIHLLEPRWKSVEGQDKSEATGITISPESFRDKLVIIGATAPEFHDRLCTSVGLLSGVEIIAHGINTILQSVQIRNWDSIFFRLGFLFIIGALAFVTFANPHFSQNARFGFFLGAGFLVVAGNLFFFRYFHRQVPVVSGLGFTLYLFVTQLGFWGFQERLAKEGMEHELEIGHKMQVSLLPKKLPDMKGISLFASSLPAKEIGGDLYDFVPFPDGRLGVIIGDVAGKGVEAGLFMAMATVILKHFARENDSPRLALAQASQALKEHFEGVSPNYLTCAMAIIDPFNMSITLSNAGHELPILILSGDNSIKEIEIFGPPLGPVWLFPTIQYDEFSTRIPGGATLIFYTDGFPEAFNEKEEQFGRERFFSLVEKNSQVSPEILGKTLFQEISGFETEPSDDKTIVIVRVEGKPDSFSIDPHLEEKLVQCRRQEGWTAKEVPADIEVLEKVADELVSLAKENSFSVPDCFGLELLLEEIFSNVWKHSCNKDSTQSIALLFRFCPSKFELFLKDPGCGFPVQKVFTRSFGNDGPTFADSGRGIPLIKKYADQITFNPSGNVIYLGKEKTTGG